MLLESLMGGESNEAVGSLTTDRLAPTIRNTVTSLQGHYSTAILLATLGVTLVVYGGGLTAHSLLPYALCSTLPNQARMYLDRFQA